MAEPLAPLTPDEAALLEKIVGQAAGGQLLTAGLPVAAAAGAPGAVDATPPPEVSFLPTRIPPPSPLYLTREDLLQIELYNSVTSAVISLGARFLRPDGVIVPVVQDFRPTNDRARNVFTLKLGEGYLLGLHFGTGTVTQPGQAYALVTIIRAGFPLGTNLQTIVAGYVTTTQRPGWPITPPRDPRDGPGRLLFQQGTNPAPGTGVLVGVPTNARWELIMVNISLTTSATAANRLVNMQLQIAGGPVGEISEPAFQTATQTISHVWAQGIPAVAVAGGIRFNTGLPARPVLRAGDFFQISADNLQAGDDFTAPFFGVQEWIDQ